MNLNTKYDLIVKPVTLDGKPARITGAMLRYAVVRDENGRSFEWAWESVQAIVAKGGNFQS